MIFSWAVSVDTKSALMLAYQHLTTLYKLARRQHVDDFLLKSAVPRGFYRDVLEMELRTPSSEPLWRTFGISVLDSKVCRRVGNNGLEEVSFLSLDPQLIDPTTCLHPETNPNPNPSLISLLITGNVPRELIGETLSIFLVTGSCQMPGIQSEPIAIRGKCNPQC